MSMMLLAHTKAVIDSGPNDRCAGLASAEDGEDGLNQQVRNNLY